MIRRRLTRAVRVRNVAIGAGSPVSVQSMTNTVTADIEATVTQINALAAAGCDLVRVSIPDEASVNAFREIRRRTAVPLVADIHFQYRFAVAAIAAGADKVRINPGNIGAADRVRAVVDAARSAGIPLRIGINAGSLEPDILARHGHPTADALVESALRNIRLVESMGFDDIVISIKASDVLSTIAACTALSEASDRPQHIGITEAGTVRGGSIRSAVGLGALLLRGIGDTIRVSLAGDPLDEVYAAREILKALKLADGPVVLACPTCSRTRIDVASLARQVEEMVAPLSTPVTIAVMGCIVNGPGEAREADLGVAGGAGEGEIFVKGVCVEKVPESELLSSLRRHLDAYVTARSGESS